MSFPLQKDWRCNDERIGRQVTVLQQSDKTPTAGIDWTRPVLLLFAAFLIVLILLPMSWLALYSITDKANHLTLQNFATLFTDPDFLDPLITTAIIATTSAIACCAVAAPMGWLVSRTDVPGRQFIRALVTASFVTPPFLGAVAWELLAAPNSGLLNQLYRLLTGADSDEHLFNIYSLPGVIFVISCYTFPFVFVLVANALDNMPGELEDASAILGGKAWTTARRVTIPLALPALVAGALIAFLQAMTLFGSPAILALPAGFHTMTTKIWSLFQYPPRLELAAAAAVPLLILTILLLQGQKFILGRRGYSVLGGKYGAPRRVEMKRWRWAALAFCLLMLLNPVFSHPQRRRHPCDTPSNAAQPDQAERCAGNLFRVCSLAPYCFLAPLMLLLKCGGLRDLLRERKDQSDYTLSDNGTMHLGRVREHDITIHKLRKQELMDCGGGRVNPTQRLAHCELLGPKVRW